MVGVAQDHPIPIVNFAVQKPDAGRQFVLCNWVRPRQRSGTLLCLSRQDHRKRQAWKRAQADSPHVIVVGTNLDPISTVCNFSSAVLSLLEIPFRPFPKTISRSSRALSARRMYPREVSLTTLVSEDQSPRRRATWGTLAR